MQKTLGFRLLKSTERLVFVGAMVCKISPVASELVIFRRILDSELGTKRIIRDWSHRKV